MTITHNFALTDEQSMILDSVRGAVEAAIAPHALHADEHREFVAEGFKQLSELGLFGLAVSEQGGGTGLGMLALALAVEAVAKGCSSTARILMTQAGICARALDGLPAAKPWLDEIVAGSKLAAFCGPEHRFVAEPRGGGYSLTGRAELVTGAERADIVVVAARVGPEHALFVLDAKAFGRGPVGTLGFRAAACGGFVAEAGAVSAGTPVAAGADAKAALERAELAALTLGAALASGLAQASFDCARRHSGERIAFGKPLLKQPAVANKLVEMHRRGESARHLVFHAARLIDLAQDAREAAMAAKLEAIESAMLCADEGIQIHGGYGFVVEYHVERHYRDAKTLEILDGGCESLRERLAVELAT
jgi:alkylation response protein AidB-like acyl-CoA dehydrogenase